MLFRRMEYKSFINIGFIIFVFSLPGNWAVDENGSDNQTADAQEFYKYPTPILLNELETAADFYSSQNKSYNWGIFGFGVSHFMSYAAHFCKYEAEDGSLEVVSVGSGDGAIEKDIIAMHEDLFGTKLNITLVDNDPKFVNNVHFRTVNDLIKSRPTIVDSCVLLLIWPESEEKLNDYDIEAVYKLQPLSVLTLYETKRQKSGSSDFQRWLISCAVQNYCNYTFVYDNDKYSGLKNYEIEDHVTQPVNYKTGVYRHVVDACVVDNTTSEVSPEKPCLNLIITRLRRNDS